MLHSYDEIVSPKVTENGLISLKINHC